MSVLERCIIAPDSFKGTLSAIDVCQIVQEEIRKVFPMCEVKTFPMADGGEGTVDCFLLALDAEKRTVATTGPFGESVEAYYAIDGRRAIVEMAQVAGLPQVVGREDPRKATTFGLGAVILDAVQAGCDEIIIGLGGSCTNDAGIGMARALGVRFFDADGTEIAPDADEMTAVERIDVTAAREALEGVRITAMCDITNPMYGEKGAAYIFAPQKGADAETVRVLDENLRHLAGVIERECGVAVADLPGAGAAGALGAGVVAFLGGTLRSGIETVLDAVGFDDALSGADLVFTGEGKFDAQSIDGKVISGIAKRAAAKDVPVVVIAGAVDRDLDPAGMEGVKAAFSINRLAEDFSVSRSHARENLAQTVASLMRFYEIMSPAKSVQYLHGAG